MSETTTQTVAQTQNDDLQSVIHAMTQSQNFTGRLDLVESVIEYKTTHKPFDRDEAKRLVYRCPGDGSHGIAYTAQLVAGSTHHVDVEIKEDYDGEGIRRVIITV